MLYSLFGILALAFDIWMILDVIRKPFEMPEKVIWILAILIFPLLGAALYFFLRYNAKT